MTQTKARVLLVEDEDDARRSLVRSFVRAGVACLEASTLTGALDVLSAAPFIDVVVTDIVLCDRGDGGLELLSRLRALGIRAPVVVITAFADVAKLKRALNQGAAHVLEKPFRASELVEVVLRLASDTGNLEHLVERAFTRAALTEKECAVARHLLKGLTSQEIASVQGNSEKTIRQHVSTIYSKCGVSSRAELFHFVFPS